MKIVGPAPKFDVPHPKKPAIGDIYTVNGGRGKGGRRYQVIVGQAGEFSYLLTFCAKTGEVCGVNHYGNWYLERRVVVGRAHGIDAIKIKAEFF